MKTPEAVIPEDARFVQELIDEIPVNATDAERRETEELVTGFTSEIEEEEARQAAIDVLISAVRYRSPELRALIEERNEVKFGRGVAEIGLEDLRTGLERIAAGKNSGLVIRAGEYADFDQDILEAVKTVGKLEQKGQPVSFPNAVMKRHHSTSSALHLDIDTDGSDERFPIAVSVSRTEEGSVLFMSGLASKKVKGWDGSEYDFKKSRLDRAQSIRRMNGLAVDGNPPARREWTARESVISVDLTAVTLHEGDIAIWPQGGKGTELPAWHAFRQIGETPRESTTYHFVQSEA